MAALNRRLGEVANPKAFLHWVIGTVGRGEHPEIVLIRVLEVPCAECVHASRRLYAREQSAESVGHMLSLGSQSLGDIILPTQCCGHRSSCTSGRSVDRLVRLNGETLALFSIRDGNVAISKIDRTPRS